ncbi:4-amino-4-deoxy-L-arabinose transferase-like glycosyltransferase [Allocatelliglobosispora scoriae]|uniref:4-amino-4-deoxy-L-arabinose transferase-like glycosyltransferase n=1 Tax=Allocatelliglobosispora scoriae TaxID=643052 RepID=A0A841BZE0_9ACTN|nr:glycosyltransferase family 39 protein [Allocatelliglobosispora scoriae]MBB5872273.1 4-amino-4-deoxy-L-arabinose transferase-like glycosyltransferase [Allocatelliglobosispora scoriae]
MTLPGIAWRPITIVSLVTLVVNLLAATRYGYHRDELYFRQLGEHPAWGYVDQGPATPLIGRVATELFGDSFFALRLPAVLCAALIPLLVALIVRELGGERTGQWLGGAAVALGGFPVGIGHLLLTASFDVPLSLLALLFVTRALKRVDGRWWLAAGAVMGLALYNKQLIILLGLGVVAALLIVGPRDVFRDWRLWAGLGLAVVIGSPNLIYQLTHDFPQLTMAGALADNDGVENRLLFVPMQLVLIGVTLVPIWVVGARGFFREEAWRRVRALPIAYAVACVIVLATGGRPDYVAPLLILVLCAGFARLHTWRWPAIAVAVNVVGSALLVLPVFPVGMLGDSPVPVVNQLMVDQVGWEAYVAQVAAVHSALPAADRADAVVVTANYGESGAVDRYAPALPVYSGQNELYFRARPPESARVLIAVGYSPRRLGPHFASCEIAARLDNGVGVDNEEQTLPITVCRDPREPWSALWPFFQHYD